VPTILLDSFVEGLPYDVVKLDNIAAGRIATEYLIGLGHRRIAATVGRDNIVTGEDRLEGYLQAHASNGLPVDNSLLLSGRFDQVLAHDNTMRRMQQPDPPTAIFALSNMMMLGVLNALRELRLNVPGDVSVIGIDDFDFANIMNPPPTVVAAPVLEMAQMSITALLDEIARKAPPAGRTTIFQPRLIIRESCAAHTAVDMERPWR
jgi:LacI family transcriptional regulator